jgi:hypothetical protein
MQPGDLFFVLAGHGFGDAPDMVDERTAGFRRLSLMGLRRDGNRLVDQFRHLSVSRPLGGTL